MKTYRITFKPVEPYFFGNEKTFRFKKKGKNDETQDGKAIGQYDDPYFIRSEKMPSQTTIFGAIRYLLLPERNSNFGKYMPGYEEYIGKDTWKIDETNQTFGRIKCISPIFLVRNGENCVVEEEESKPKDGIYIPTPLDCRTVDETGKKEKVTEYKHLETKIYSGFEQCVVYSDEYNPKYPLPESYVCIDDKSIVLASDIFKTSVRVGNNLKQYKSGFFKKEYCILNDGWSFGVYLTINDDKPLDISDTFVYLGQNKSTFVVSCCEEAVCLDNFRHYLSEDAVYFMSDTYVDTADFVTGTFPIIMTKDYRTMSTVSAESGKLKYKKDDVLYRLIKAGSVIRTDSKEKAKEQKDKLINAHCKIVGMNAIIIEAEEYFKEE